VIPTNVFGEADNFNLEDSHVVPGLIHKFHLALKFGLSSVHVSGTGKPLRQFIYSLDLAKLLLWAVHNYDDDEPVILSPPESDEISINELAELISQKSGFKGSIEVSKSITIKCIHYN
jgi:GDP-L-fucose synthase